MNELTTYSNPDLGNVRTLTIDGEPWFVGKDVAEILGYSNTRDALSKHIDDEDKNTVAFHDGIKGNPYQTIINESGLYSLILSSKLPNAKKFKHWVTKEVLPAIRKTGSYNTNGGYSTTYSAAEVREIITQEAARMLMKINSRLGLRDDDEQEPPPKQFRTKLGKLPKEQRKDIDRIIRDSSSYEQAAYEIQIYIKIRISASGVRNYAKEAGLRG